MKNKKVIYFVLMFILLIIVIIFLIIKNNKEEPSYESYSRGVLDEVISKIKSTNLEEEYNFSINEITKDDIVVNENGYIFVFITTKDGRYCTIEINSSDISIKEHTTPSIEGG